jgi:glycosyltransferase involved in cell wall biosynthesis
MKVLHINQSDSSGGAAIAGYRLHEGLIKQGIESRLLVGKRTKKNDPLIEPIPRSYRLEYSEIITKQLGLNYIHYLGSIKILKHKFYQEADIINLHNLHSNTFSYVTLPKLTENKPAVWTLHDMWSFTGHCAYSYDCDRFVSGCGKCPYPQSYPTINRDNTALEWKIKNWVYEKSNLTIIAPSKWLTEQAQKSMLNRFEIKYIPNGLDTQIYQPYDFQLCRRILNIQKNKKVLMFASASLTDSRKGSDLVIKSLSSLPEPLKCEIVLLIMGNDNQNMEQTIGIDTIEIGYVNQDYFKAIAYSASDLFIFPTRADNLPLTLQECLACGLPMVSFNIGGVPDLVRHGITGYLAKPENVEDFTKGIIELLEDNQLREKMSQNCRQIAVEEYSLELQAQRYIEVYKSLLNES